MHRLESRRRGRRGRGTQSPPPRLMGFDGAPPTGRGAVAVR
ncbi:MAG TPA: hypothetical protein VHY83_02565 [Solirubrobacteraceae bacterium]|nr:hypothetical protein [Solirubrobacteraceae bacterium]